MPVSNFGKKCLGGQIYSVITPKPSWIISEDGKGQRGAPPFLFTRCGPTVTVSLFWSLNNIFWIRYGSTTAPRTENYQCMLSKNINWRSEVDKNKNSNNKKEHLQALNTIYDDLAKRSLVDIDWGIFWGLTLGRNQSSRIKPTCSNSRHLPPVIDIGRTGERP